MLYYVRLGGQVMTRDKNDVKEEVWRFWNRGFQAEKDTKRQSAKVEIRWVSSWNRKTRVTGAECKGQRSGRRGQRTDHVGCIDQGRSLNFILHVRNRIL